MSAEGRDLAGRFVKGNAGGPGRPKGNEECLTTLRESVTLQEWREVVTKALTDAKAGNATAREWLGKYLLPPVGALNLLNTGEQVIRVIWDDESPKQFNDEDGDEGKDEGEALSMQAVDALPTPNVTAASNAT